MSMTRRHFEALAVVIGNAQNSAAGGMDAETIVHRIRESIGDLARRENPRFDYGRFINKCDAIANDTETQ